MRPAGNPRKAGKSGFFSGISGPNKPMLQHVEIKKPRVKHTPPTLPTSEQVFNALEVKAIKAAIAAAPAERAATIALDQSLMQFKNAFSTAQNIVEQLKSGTSTLPTAYRQREAAQVGFFDRPAGNSPEPEEISFIMSIASSLKLEANLTPVYTAALIGDKSKASRLLKDDTQQVNKIATSMTSIIDGAYIAFMDKIATSFSKNWWYTNPMTNPLYAEMSERVKTKTNEEKVTCLVALQDYLRTPEAQATVKFGSRTAETMLADIQEQIDALLPSSSIKPK